MLRIKALLSRLASEERGVTTAEYAVMLVLVAIAVAGFGPGISDAIQGVFTDFVNILTGAAP